MRPNVVRRILSASLPLWLTFAAAVVSAQTTASPTLNLFNGSSLFGWSPTGSWTATSAILGTNGSGNRLIVTAMPFADISLQFEYNVSENMNAGLRLATTRDGRGGLRIDLDNSGAPWGVGGIEEIAHSKNTAVSAGWHRAQVTLKNGHLEVLIDGTQFAESNDVGARAGYLGFETTGTGNLQLRSIRVTPEGFKATFNGNDLSGWKSVAHSPGQANNASHTLEKRLTFGLGGNAKPHNANWTVRSGAIHGENGPGGLETSSMYEDVILHISAALKGAPTKKEDFTGIYLRNTAGQLSGGYPVGIGNYSGQVNNLAAHAATAGAQVDETVVLAGRTVAIWVGPNLTTLYTDSRPEGSNVAQGAKTNAGALTLVLPNDKQSVDVQRLAVASMPKAYGLAAKAEPPPPPPPPPTPVAPPVSPEVAAQTALLQQQQQTTEKQAADATAAKQRSAALMNQALSAPTPQEQMSLYSQVIQIDPSNSAAVQGFRDAQAKVEAEQTTEQKQATAQVVQQKTAASREQQTLNSLSSAQTAFLGGHLSEASRALMVAERLAPGNPLVRDLRSRISSASSLRTRLFFLAGGGGVLGIAGLITWMMRRRRQQKFPVLALTRGLDTGQRYPLDRDTIRIGAVPQDGGQKNDIVVRDVEHAVSRFHCEIQRSNGQMFVTDLNSSNGTRMNGERLDPGKPTLLRKGAKLDLGGSVELQLDYDRRQKIKTSQ